MASEDELRRLALDLPEVVEADDGVFRVRGKGILWPASDRERPKEPRRRLPGVYVVRTVGLGEKQELMDAEPEIYFSTPHYDRYPAVLFRLAAISPDELGELVTDSWRIQAPRTLVRAFDAERS